MKFFTLWIFRFFAQGIPLREAICYYLHGETVIDKDATMYNKYIYHVGEGFADICIISYGDSGTES